MFGRSGPRHLSQIDGVVVDASAPKVYPRVTLASTSTLSGSVVRTVRGGEEMRHLRVRSPAAPLCKGDTVGMWRGRGDWRWLLAME